MMDPPIPDGHLDSVELAIVCAARCVSDEELVAIVESAARVNGGALDYSVLGQCERVRAALRRTDPFSVESGVETLMRLRLQHLCLKFRTQVWIGRYRVDFLVGGRLIIEVDGYQHHADQAAFRRDRERDRYLELRGFRVLRFTAAEVMFDLDACEAEVLAAIRKRIHRKRTKQASAHDSF